MKITPNQVTLARILLAFAALMLFGRHAWANILALALIAVAIALDALDGYLARRLKLATPLGAQLDILGDRVIENLLFTFFAVCGLISLWVPVAFFVRGTLTDFIRGLAARAGRPGHQKTPLDKNSMLKSRWALALVGSRFSRGAYAAMKCACFCLLGIQWTLQKSATDIFLAGTSLRALLLLAAPGLVGATLVFCLVRGVPVVWEGRRYLAALARAAAGDRVTRAHASKSLTKSSRTMSANASMIAAFFDIDGTLLGAPSLERRFLKYLRSREMFGAGNEACWLMQFLRQAWCDPLAVTDGNKAHLAGVRATTVNAWNASLRHRPLEFFPAALRRIEWHAAAGHRIFLVSGTLAPLAECVAQLLLIEATPCATALEIASDGAFTGRLAGDPVSGLGKARAMERLAAQHNLDLSHSYAYANQWSDRRMLARVGLPAAVNPSPLLALHARRRGWPALRWKEEKSPAPCPRTEKFRFACAAIAPGKNR